MELVLRKTISEFNFAPFVAKLGLTFPSARTNPGRDQMGLETAAEELAVTAAT